MPGSRVRLMRVCPRVLDIFPTSHVYEDTYISYAWSSECFSANYRFAFSPVKPWEIYFLIQLISFFPVWVQALSCQIYLSKDRNSELGRFVPRFVPSSAGEPNFSLAFVDVYAQHKALVFFLSDLYFHVDF